MSQWDLRGQTVAGNQYNADNVFTGVESPQHMLANGIRSVRERLYDEARKNLEGAIGRGVDQADAHYYLALALLAGERPSRHQRSPQELMNRVEQQLDAAVRLNPNCGHAYALWAAVKADFYGHAGGPEPSVGSLRERASTATIDPAHMPEISPFLESQQDPIWTALLDAAQRSTAERKPNVHKYFLPYPVPPALAGFQVMMVLGGGGALLALILMIVALSSSDYVLLSCPAVLLGIGGVVVGAKGAIGYFNASSAYRRAVEASEPRPTDAQMERWLQLDKFALLDVALRNLGRPQSDLLCEPQMVIGPASPSQRAVGQDRVQRFSRYKIVVLLLTERRMFAYSCEWDFVRCIVSDVDSFDFRYSDITGIRMRQPLDATAGSVLVLTDEYGQQREVKPRKVFEMIVAGTDRIAVIVDSNDDMNTVQQPTGAAAAERVIRRQLDVR
ncbi:hypothetical protein JIG36_32915 [Actinoplanes sp. LDG1-06]|uniref:Tetratricopeptide repeat protein n=1 Tax=Paractinoplanes ovalisporus TaxID=2810368 RepID=A0ABS2AKJ4_9ACTN|nr:hypothetical protein [Actinoplanes ovalisporus]MBM2620326.1 hypothetical protein [Actinoplanes ovalisporus]